MRETKRTARGQKDDVSLKPRGTKMERLVQVGERLSLRGSWNFNFFLKNGINLKAEKTGNVKINNGEAAAGSFFQLFSR